MAIDSKHPSYAKKISAWQSCRDAYEGESAVKERGDAYLPPTASMRLDGYPALNSKGTHAYDAYKLRAVFPDYMREAVQFMVGLLHQKPAEITLPKRMEPMLTRATAQGEGLQALLRRITAEQLITGRIGLLADMPEVSVSALPYLATYCAEAVINWNESADHVGVNKLNLVVLDESGPVQRSDLTWEDREQFRILRLMPLREAAEPVASKDGTVTGSIETPDAVVTVREGVSVVYKQDVVIRRAGEDVSFSDDMAAPPVVRGKALEQIPFVLVNTTDLVVEPDVPPLLGLVQLCMSIYRSEADYRENLYMQGQDTLVTIGGVVDTSSSAQLGTTDDGVRVGAGARIDLNIGGDAKYIGVSGDGLAEQREALQNDRRAAETKSGQLISPSAGKQESGDALTTRLSAQTASLNQIAHTSAAGLQNALRIIAEWIGENPEEVVVTPNTEYTSQQIVAKDLVDMMTARSLGLPLSIASVHEYLVSRGLTSKTLDEELELIAEEDLKMAQRGAKIAAEFPPPAPAPAPKPGSPSQAPASPAPAAK